MAAPFPRSHQTQAHVIAAKTDQGAQSCEPATHHRGLSPACRDQVNHAPAAAIEGNSLRQRGRPGQCCHIASVGLWIATSEANDIRYSSIQPTPTPEASSSPVTGIARSRAALRHCHIKFERAAGPTEVPSHGSCCQLGASILFPVMECLGADRTIDGGGKSVTTRTKVAVDE